MKDRILKLRSEGKTYNEIKKIIGCSKGTISFHCGKGQKEKFKIRRRRSRARKKTIKSFEQDMDDKTWIGSLAEIKVVSELTMRKFHVFNQVSGKAPYDLIAVKNNKIIRISVKGTSSKKNKTNAYSIQIGKIRSNKNVNKIYKFNNAECDYLAIYIFDIDTVCFINSNDIKTGRQIHLRMDNSKNSRSGKSWVIGNLREIIL